MKRSQSLNLRSYYYTNNILNNILYYKDIQLKKKKNKLIKKLILNFKILHEKNKYFLYLFLNILRFFKLFSKKVCIKNLIIGQFNSIFKNIILDKSNIFCIIQFILTKKKIYIFFNYFIIIFKKYILMNKKDNSNLKINIKYFKQIKKLYLNIIGFFEIDLRLNNVNSPNDCYFNSKDFLNFFNFLNVK